MAAPVKVDSQRPGPADLFRQMGPELYRRAYDRGMSLSVYLEYQDPSSQYKDGSDAFGRILREAGIVTDTLWDLGLYASAYEMFDRDEHTRALVPEYIHRIWRGVQTGRRVNTRSLYQSGDDVPGSWGHPYADAQDARWSQMIAPAIPLASLIAMTTPIDSDAYRTYYLQHSAAAVRKVRVGEGAEVPRVKLTASEHTIDLFKYGRTLEATYEQLRRQRLDKIAFHIRQMAVQSEIDKVAAVIDVAVNGDGNSGTTPTSYNLTTLDTDASAGTLTVKGWIAFKMQFANPYTVQVALAQEAIALQLLLLNLGDANTPLVTISAMSGFGGFEQINPGLRDNVGLGWTTDAPANKIVGIDTRMAIERVIEIGSNIDEIERFATHQTQTLTMTEVEGYGVIDANATKILVVNA